MSCFQFDKIMFYGRTWQEYCQMFLLDPKDLTGKKVLDCPSGFGSFAAEAGSRNLDIAAVDPLFAVDRKNLLNLAEKATEGLLEESFHHPDLLMLQNMGTPEQIKQFRRQTFSAFYEDFVERRNGAYVAASLPRLPFADNTFDLSLSGHFLFCYDKHLSWEFHVNSIFELLRITRHEIRIYPIRGLDTKLSPHFERIRALLADLGIQSEVVEVPYEMVRCWREMLILHKTS